jgi:hypothetical protein
VFDEEPPNKIKLAHSVKIIPITAVKTNSPKKLIVFFILITPKYKTA